MRRDPRAPYAARPALPKLRPGADPARAVRDPLVRARLYCRHPARLALRPRDHPHGQILGRPGADDGDGFRRFHRVGDARHHSRRPASAMCCSTIPSISPRTRSKPSSCGRAACRSMAASPAAFSAVVLFAKKPRHSGAVARRRHLRGRADRPVPRAARELHQRRIVGPPDATCPGRWCFRPAARCRAIRASSMRRRWKASACCCCLRSASARAR